MNFLCFCMIHQPSDCTNKIYMTWNIVVYNFSKMNYDDKLSQAEDTYLTNLAVDSATRVKRHRAATATFILTLDRTSRSSYSGRMKLHSSARAVFTRPRGMGEICLLRTGSCVAKIYSAMHVSRTAAVANSIDHIARSCGACDVHRQRA